MKEIINASEAARILGCTPQKVRVRIKEGVWKFGRRIPGNKQDVYEIYTRKMFKELGIPEKE